MYSNSSSIICNVNMYISMLLSLVIKKPYPKLKEALSSRGKKAVFAFLKVASNIHIISRLKGGKNDTFRLELKSFKHCVKISQKLRIATNC